MTFEEMRDQYFPYFERWIGLLLGLKGPNLPVSKHRIASAIIGAAYKAKVDPTKFSEQQWTDTVEFARRPQELAKKYECEWPVSKGRWDGEKGYRAQMEAAQKVVAKIANQGDPPENLELLDPQTRYYPPSWRDAAIRASFDMAREGVLCCECRQIFRGRRELRLLECDHIHPWSQGGLTTWGNLQLLCRPCNRSKTDTLPATVV